MYSRLSLSRSPRDSLKYFEISVPQHIRFAELEKKNKLNNHISQIICNWTPEVLDILKILWKIAEMQFLLFSTIFYNLLLDINV